MRCLSLAIALLLSLAVTAAADSRDELAAARAQKLQLLHDYRVAAVYPIGLDSMPLAVFRDARGRMCPMAHLISKSGHDDLVTAVAAQNNALRLADVTEGPLVDWILDSGLTREEVIEIQGMMELDSRQFEHSPASIIAAHREVTQRLERVEAKLRKATKASLAVAVERLPVPHVASTAPIVPKKLVAAK
jgi:hypothetical protein